MPRITDVVSEVYMRSQRSRPSGSALRTVKQVIETFEIEDVITERDMSWYIRNGCINYWSLNDETISGATVRDLEGSDDGTITGSPTTESGIIHSALGFDGSADYMTATPSNLASGGISIECWFNPTQVTGADTLVEHQPVSLGGWIIDYSTVTLDFILKGPDPPGYYGAQLVLPAALLGRWHHVVCTYDGSIIKAYLDGIQAIGNSVSQALLTTGTVLLCGSSNRANAKIEQFRLYSRALTEEEVTVNYLARSFPIWGVYGAWNEGFVGQ
uniref:Putative structural protein n=1 Tax=viral metagenome TaxID=1070528 RepID=A0A6H1ZU37_9ZZZZ